MENSNQKILTLAYVILGFVTAIVVNVLLETLAASWGPFARLYSNDIVRHGIPVASGFLIFAYMQFNKNVQTWADESMSELLKVVWPTRKDTTAMTIVCCVMLIMASVVLAIFDYISHAAVKVIIN